MKKVGIITFHSTNNYGAALQCYALQKAIENSKNDSWVINYTANMLKRPYGLTALREKGIKRYFLGILYSFLRSFRNKNFKRFRNKIKQTSKIRKKDLRDLNEDFDTFITGSDQVWNGTITSYDDAYFLAFVDDKKKKNSYAASFGMNVIPGPKRDLYKSLLSGFSTYNLREKSGVTIVQDLLNKEAKQTIDPTLLLSKTDWESITLDSKIKPNYKYIFVYQISPSSNLPYIVGELKKRTKLKIIAIPFIIGNAPRHKTIINAGPIEWLYLLKNAEYVVTDSFHGTAFSVVFNKVFFSCADTNESRLSSFLKLVELQDRLVDNKKLPSNYDSVDFTKANHIVDFERKKGLMALDDIVLK